MTQGINRRGLLKGAGVLAAGSAVTFMGEGARASENMQGDRVLTVLFPNDEGATFDFDYYLGHHVPLVLSLYGKSIRRYEVIRPEAGLGGRKPPYIAITQIWIADPEAYARATVDAAPKFNADIKMVTNVTPTGQTGHLYGILET